MKVIHTARRNRLTVEMADKLVCLHINIKTLNDQDKKHKKRQKRQLRILTNKNTTEDRKQTKKKALLDDETAQIIKNKIARAEHNKQHI